jgi:hypothetical protein
MVTNMQKLKSVISLVLLATFGLLTALISPLVVLFASISIITFLAIARQMNFYKIVMVIKRYAQTVSRLRFEIRAKLHTGFRDYSVSLESEESPRGSCGYIK